MAKKNKILLSKNKIKKDRVKKNLKSKLSPQQEKQEKTITNLKKVQKIEKNVNKQNLDSEENEMENEIEEIDQPKQKLLQESVKDHFFTFQQKIELFTLLYTTVVFKWIQTDRVFIIVDDNKLGYHLELFLKFFRFNSVFLDSEMPVNTNKHYFNQFLKGVFNICISSTKFTETSPQFAKESVDQTPIPATIIYFDTIDPELLEYHSFHSNTKAIYHFISNDKKKEFSEEYEELDERIRFDEFNFDKDQVSHLRYRCEDIYHSIHKSDIKKAKTKKINQELLNSKNMQEYFKLHPEEKIKIIKSIQDNSIKGIKPSASYLPSYLIHEEGSSDKNVIAQAIKKNYKEKAKGSKWKKRGTMDKYLESLEKNDGTAEQIKF